MLILRDALNWRCWGDCNVRGERLHAHIRAGRCRLTIYVGASRDGDDKNRHLRIVDRVDDAVITNAVSKGSGEPALEWLDVVPAARVFLK